MKKLFFSLSFVSLVTSIIKFIALLQLITVSDDTRMVAEKEFVIFLALGVLSVFFLFAGFLIIENTRAFCKKV